MSRRFTVALRVCVSCGSAFGVGLWPWTGERFTRTHGLCRSCFRSLDAAFEDERAKQAQPAARPQPSHHLGAGI